MKIGCGITAESSKVINENLNYFRKLKEISLGSNKENKVDNLIGDDGFIAIFNNIRYLSTLEVLKLLGKNKHKNRMWNNIKTSECDT